MLKLTIYLLRFLNLGHYYLWTILGKFSPVPRWTEELSQYYKTTPGAVVRAYQQKRPVAARLWLKKPRRQLKDIFSFYSESDYWVYRQTYFNHRKTFFDIAWPMLFKAGGSFCEYGGGVGPVTSWLIKRFPNWQYQIVDLDCPALKFSRWRFRHQPQVSLAMVRSAAPPLETSFDVITCKQVLEHVPNPLVVIKALVKHLNPGGWLFLDYVNHPGRENLIRSAQKRRQVLKYLDSQLQAIFKINPDTSHEGYGLYIKAK